MGLAGSLMLCVAEEEGLQTISEVFADRHYMPDGSFSASFATECHGGV